MNHEFPLQEGNRKSHETKKTISLIDLDENRSHEFHIKSTVAPPNKLRGQRGTSTPPRPKNIYFAR